MGLLFDSIDNILFLDIRRVPPHRKVNGLVNQGLNVSTRTQSRPLQQLPDEGLAQGIFGLVHVPVEYLDAGLQIRHLDLYL